MVGGNLKIQTVHHLHNQVPLKNKEDPVVNQHFYLQNIMDVLTLSDCLMLNGKHPH